MKGLLKRLGLSSAAFLLLAATSSSSMAGLIKFTEAVTGSGTLDGKTFSDRLITITYVGDTTNITTVGGVSVLTGGTATVEVTGVGTDTFAAADRMQVFADSTSSPTASVGIRDGSASAIELATFKASLAGYQLTAPYGPVSGGAYFASGNDATTSGGSFEITATTGLSTFTAVPEPSSLVLAGIGILGVLASRIIRSRRAGGSGGSAPC